MTFDQVSGKRQVNCGQVIPKSYDSVKIKMLICRWNWFGVDQFGGSSQPSGISGECTYWWILKWVVGSLSNRLIHKHTLAVKGKAALKSFSINLVALRWTCSKANNYVL